MKLSPHFSLEEMTRSETGARLGLDNSCPGALFSRLQNTAERMEEIRTILGDAPITVLSGYRSAQVNKAVGGSSTSDHKQAYAVDFRLSKMDIQETIKAIRNSGIKFDQLIDEFSSWVHISFNPKNRRQVMSARKIGAKTVYKFI